LLWQLAAKKKKCQLLLHPPWLLPLLLWLTLLKTQLLLLLALPLLLLPALPLLPLTLPKLALLPL
jgi:hypothetical protein